MPSNKRGDWLVNVLQPQKIPLETGLDQSDAVRAKVVCGTLEVCHIMNALRDTEFRGKFNESFI
jgi:hypothetical protein